MRHVIVISEDAMVFEDTETLKHLPNFGKIWDKAARVNRVRSIYPTITYPCHVSMMTGMYPDKHGVVNNERPIMCEKSSPWEFFASAVKVPTLFDKAHEAGMKTACIFWPVCAQSPSIDYLLAEYWPQHGESVRQSYIDAGASPDVIKIVDRYANLNVPRQHPEADNFITMCAADIIREFKPQLLMLHPANIDAYRHGTGVFSDKVTHGLHEIDVWLGDIMRACRDAGIYDDTDFFIVSDHGQLNISRSVSPNAMLAKHGLIDVDADGKITDWRAFCKSAALSSQVYLKDPSDKQAYDATYALLSDMCKAGIYGISRVYTAEEAEREEHLKGGFSFVLESDGFSSFSNDWKGPYVRTLDNSDYRFGHATHGHQPDKGPQPTLIAFGPDINEGAVVERASIVDEPVTVAKVLGLDLGDTDGKVIEGILK